MAQRDQERILLMLRGADAQYKTAQATRKKLVQEAAALRVKNVDIAKALDVTPGRVSQMLKEGD